MIRSIGVTTDFSPLSREPFPAAAYLARRLDADLTLVHVAEDPETYTAWQVVDESPEETERRYEELRGKLEELAAGEPSFAGLRVHRRVLPTDSGETIHRFQEREAVDLIIMASHGHTGIEHFLLGSFAARVLQLVSCPVLLFRSRTEPSQKPAAEFEPRRILVSHDFSRASSRALDVARFWTREFDAEARLFFVLERPAGAVGPDDGGPDLEGVLEKARTEAEKQLRKVAEEDWSGLRVSTVVRVGRPPAQILEEARSFDADLIIMASRGLSTLERLNIGSVTERVVHTATTPVLIVRREPEEVSETFLAG